MDSSFSYLAVLPIDVALGNNPDVSFSSDSSNRVRHLTSRPSAIREGVKRRLFIIQEKQKRRFDCRRRYVSYEVGDLVLVYRPIKKKVRTTKFLHRYFGPHTIVRRVSRKRTVFMYPI